MPEQSHTPQPGSQAWLDQVIEAPLAPQQPIIDPHHHLWFGRGGDYLLEQLHADTGSGHRIVQTVFVECHAEYRASGPEAMRPVGETEFVAAQAALAEQTSGARIGGIVAHADLRSKELPAVLDAHEAAGQGRFKGIRHALARAEHPQALLIPGAAPKDLYCDKNFVAGVRLLGSRGLTYDSWHYHYQNAEFLALAESAPDTVMVLDHFGTPLGVGPYADQREPIFDQWRRDIERIAQRPNVVLKAGGLAMPDNGFGWHAAAKPPDSDGFAEAQARYYHHAIDCFGPERCMLESNFPVDRLSLSYGVLFNGLKKIVARYSPEQQQSLFYGTAARVYSLE